MVRVRQAENEKALMFFEVFLELVLSVKDMGREGQGIVPKTFSSDWQKQPSQALQILTAIRI